VISRKQSVAQSQADLEAYEAEINTARQSFAAASQKAQELKASIESAERELSNHSEEAVNQSIEQAAKIWHLRHQSPHNSSVVDSAIAHALEADIVLKVLNARLIQLRDALAKEEVKVDSFKRQLRDLEKQA
jgi:chromosome segregation ATPase